MPKKKKKSKSTKTSKPPARIKLLAGLLIVIAVAGIAAVKFFQTPTGRVLLLDAGMEAYYAQVQQEVDDALLVALDRFGLEREVERRGTPYRWWRVECGPECDLVSVNVALTNAARSAGALVLRSDESHGGERLTIHIGSRRRATHRIVISKSRPPGEIVPKKALARVALVIDDFGYSRSGVADELLAMDMPLTIAILPTLKQTRYALRRAREFKKCVLLHLPMEAMDQESYDISPINTGMSDEEIEAMVAGYLDELPGVQGVNNHQGSRATQDPRLMRRVLEVLAKRQLFFLDSLTSSKSVAYNTARELALPAARNSVFIDADTEEPEEIKRRLAQLVATAKKNGKAVGIGHPHRWTLEAIKTSVALLDEEIELVFVSELVE